MWPLRPLRGHISYTVGSRAAAKQRWWRRLWPMTLPFPLPLPPPPLQPQNFQRWDFLVLVQPRISNGRTFQNPCSPGVQRPVLRHVVCMIRLIKKVDRKKNCKKCCHGLHLALIESRAVQCPRHSGFLLFRFLSFVVSWERIADYCNLQGCVLAPQEGADGHTVLNAPDLFRPPKLSSTGPG